MELEWKCKLSKGNNESLFFPDSDQCNHIRKLFGKIFYYAQVGTDELKGFEGSDLQGTKWIQPMDCLVLWAAELIEKQTFSSAGTESKSQDNHAWNLGSQCISSTAGL